MAINGYGDPSLESESLFMGIGERWSAEDAARRGGVTDKAPGGSTRHDFVEGHGDHDGRR